MKNLKLTLFSKVLLGILGICIIAGCIILLTGITYITPTRKAIVNNKLLLENGWYWISPFQKTIISDYPNSFDTKFNLDLQLNNGKIYYCKVLVKSKIDEKWVLEHKQSPSIKIPIESLNSYVLDYVGSMNESKLFEQKTKAEIEEAVEAWLMQNINEKTNSNSGIIITDIKIYTPFISKEFEQCHHEFIKCQH